MEAHGWVNELARPGVWQLGGILSVSNFGKYAQITIDSSDDCTFWFASSYYPRSKTATRRTLQYASAHSASRRFLRADGERDP
jgi:hypothetical protein